ncbi:MAG TPA: TIM barrel protein [Ktedonobacteraceae bacterium]|nr:TIM barrel protein [Ktedonobacteraceae bacterium]
MSRIHLGINTCFAVKRWPEPEQWVRIVHDELGLDCCQFSFDLIDPLFDEEAVQAYADETREVASARGLQIHSTFTGLAAYSWSQLLHPDARLRLAALRWYKRAIEVTARLGAWGTGGHIGAFSVRDFSHTERKSALLTELQEHLSTLSDYASQHGLRFLLFENMAAEREWGHTLDEAQWLDQLDTAVPLVLCFDVGHVLRTNTLSATYQNWFAASWRQIPIIHLQQSDLLNDHHWPFTEAYNKQGVIEAGDILQAIAHWQRHEDLYLFLEPIHPFEAPDTLVLDELRASVTYWRRFLVQQSPGASS